MLLALLTLLTLGAFLMFLGLLKLLLSKYVEFGIRIVWICRNFFKPIYDCLIATWQ